MAIITSAVRLFARSYMPNYISQGFSSRAIQRDLRSRFGGAYRFQDIQTDMRRVTLQGKKQKMLERLDPHQAIPRSAMIEEKFGYDTKYKIHVKMTVYDVESDKEIEKRASFFDDVNRGDEGWANEWKRQFGNSDSEQLGPLVEFDIVQVDHYPGRPY